MIVRNVQIVVIFWVSAIQLALGNDFNFVYNYASSDSIELRIVYEYYRIEEIKFPYSSQYSPISHSVENPIQIYTIHLAPCTNYQCNATVRDLRTNQTFRHSESILMVPLGIVLQTVSFSETISVLINDATFCFDNLLLVVNSLRRIWYTRTNLSSSLTINDLEPCTNHYLEIYIIDQSKSYQIYNETIKTTINSIDYDHPTIPEAPMKPQVISKSSSSLTLQTQYVNSNNKCKIEIFKISCGNAEGTRSLYDENGRVTFNNLGSGMTYNCTATAKNEMGWSNASETTSVSIAERTIDQFVQLYVNTVSSKSIGINRLTDIDGNWLLNITKIVSNDKIPKNCVVVTNQSQYAKGRGTFENLEPNSNYSIRVSDVGRETQNYYDEIFQTTEPDVPFKVTNLKYIYNISHSSNPSITVTWQLPCKVNGRIKKFVVKFLEINPFGLADTVYYWDVYYGRYNDDKIYYYTENRIKPQHNYNISVAIKLHNFVGALNESTIEFNPYPHANEANPAHNWTKGILIVGIAILFLILVGAAYWRFSNRKRNTEIVPVYAELSEFYNPRKRPSDTLIRKKFKTICNKNLSHLTKTNQNNQLLKNRNLDIIPYDFNRVALQPNEYYLTDYINASYINGYNKKREYIATQGPNEHTLYDFWHMVIQEKCKRIVMLTKLVENGCTQCASYYPKWNETLVFNDIIVKNVDETNFDHYTKRLLYITRDQITTHLYHFQYIAWSKGHSPQHPLGLIEFIEANGTQNNNTKNPIIVQSSVGAGRTGTFIALDILFKYLRMRTTYSISETVTTLRSQRCGMVQTLAQYQFLYDAIESYYLTRIYKH